MRRFIDFIIARSREGWAVNVGSDRLSFHDRKEDARAEAEALSAQARTEGVSARVVDLSEDAC